MADGANGKLIADAFAAWGHGDYVVEATAYIDTELVRQMFED